MSSSKIRSLEEVSSENLETIIHIDEQCIFPKWSSQQWSSFLESHDTSRKLLIVSESELGQLSGFSLFELNEWSEQAHLLKIAILPEFRGSTLAMELWSECCTVLRNMGKSEIFLEVSVQNQRARGFYKKLGFKKLCVKKGFYSDNSDALAMILSL